MFKRSAAAALCAVLLAVCPPHSSADPACAGTESGAVVDLMIAFGFDVQVITLEDLGMHP